MTNPQPHTWYTPAMVAALLDATKHGNSYRAACPVHAGDNPHALHIWQKDDRYGHPVTMIHCHAHQCHIEDMCAAMGVELRELFCIHPSYAKDTQRAPLANSPRIDRLKAMEEPSGDEIAQILVEEMIVSEHAFMQECQPAREKMWELAQEPKARAAFTRALVVDRIPPKRFWDKLTEEYSERVTYADEG